MKYGYFDNENREYVITNPATPAPWVNYLGSPEYGAIISNNAGGYSFAKSVQTDVSCAMFLITLTSRDVTFTFAMTDHQTSGLHPGSLQAKIWLSIRANAVTESVIQKFLPTTAIFTQKPFTMFLLEKVMKYGHYL